MKIILVVLFSMFLISLVSATIYTPTSEINCDKGRCYTTLYSNIQNVYENGNWISVDKAKSLRGSGIECVVNSDGDNIAECLDWNMTSITLKLEKKTSGISPIRIFSLNQTKVEQANRGEIIVNKPEDLYYQKLSVNYNFDNSKSVDSKQVIVSANYGDIIHFGETSTTVQLQNNETDDLANIMEGSNTEFLYGIQLKWNLNSLPSGSSIEDSNMCLFISSKVGSSDNDTRMWGIDNQTWDESTPASGINSQTKRNETDTNLSSTTLNTWSCLNVTNILNYSYNISEENFTIRIEDIDALPSSVLITSVASFYIGSPVGDSINFRRRTNVTHAPYLNITYNAPPDTTPPEFSLIPSNATLEYNNSLSVDFNSNEAVTWSVNNTTFTINSNGLLTNNTILNLGTYQLNISIIDSSGNSNYTTYQVIVNQNTGNCNVLFSATSPVYNTTNFNVWSNCLSEFTLYRNGSSILNNSEQDLDTGTYNFTVIRTDQENYSNIYDEETFRVNDAPPAPPECSTYEKLGNQIIQLSGALLVFGGSVFIFWKNDWFDLTVGQLLMIFMVIIVGVGLFMASVNVMAEGCLQ